MIESDEFKRLPYLIFEVANTHGGQKEVLGAVVDEFTKICYPKKAIKFQPFSPDLLALPDYPRYPVYQELFFPKEVWKEIISRAVAFGDVWLDIFDEYSIAILEQNKPHITGIKLQASQLDNHDLIVTLSQADLGRIQLMINISGYSISEIESFVARFMQLQPRELILQFGYQSYPTLIQDTALQKIAVLKAAFPHIPLCCADHSSAELPVAQEIPVWAVICGCSLIEKHFCSRRSEVKYDAYSALEPQEVTRMIAKLQDWLSASNGAFIPDAEHEYLARTGQIAVIRHEIDAGSMVGLTDLIFRRSGQPGLKWREIVALQSQGSVLAVPLAPHSTVTPRAFRRAKIGVIVACRMKSSRLRNKALLPIAGVPSVERCLNNCLRIRGVDEVILATSDLPEDAVLEEYAVDGKVRFWKGDPDDVILRYLGACDRYGIDVILRVTADCPVISPEIAEILMKEHFAAGADFTGAASCAVGSAVEVYNTETLRRVIRLLGTAKHSEYMTWYMKNNPEIFKLNIVDLPPSFNRDYRLTLDYEEDLTMFNQLYDELAKRRLEPDLVNVFKVLDEIPEIPAINQDMPLRYRTDQALIDMLNKETKIPKRSGHGNT